MNELEKNLLAEESGGAEPQICIRSRTRIDTGRWWWPTPLWLCVVGTELFVLAVSRRRYIERVLLSDCSGSYYCHTTGQLVIAPIEEHLYKRFNLSPLEALELLKAMGIPQWEAGAHQATPAPEQEDAYQAGQPGVEQASENSETAETKQTELNDNLNLNE